MPRLRLSALAFAGVAVVSLVVLFVPRAPATPDVPDVDKLVHASLFLALAATARWCFGPDRRALFGVVAYAVVSELVQAVALSHRSGDPLDALADTGGALLGWFLAARLLARPETRLVP